MCSFSYLEPVCCSMSSSNCCFLTGIQVSQEAVHVVWYSHLFQNCPPFVVIHTVKGFGIVNKAEIDVFLELSCFFYDLTDVGNLISGSSAFSKSSVYIWSSWFTYCWSLAWRILSTALLAGESAQLYGSWGLPGGSVDKDSACNAGELDLIPRSGRPPGEGNGNPLQYSCLENSMDKVTWRATVHGVAKSWTQLSD